MASRDYVINQASERLPKLASWLQQNTPEFAVQINYSAITDSAKADILYNLIHFSSLHGDYRHEFVDKQNYWQVIRHIHFNPRLIKALLYQAQNSDAQSLISDLIKGLDNLALYWETTFVRLSHEAQCLLYALALTSIQGTVAEEELKIAYAALYRELHGCYPPAMGLQAAIAELEPNLILSQIKHATLWFSFANPSVRDMVQGFLVQQSGIQDAVIKSMKYFSQGEFLLTFQHLKLDSRQLAEVLQNMHTLLSTGQAFINEWDGALVHSPQVSRVTRLWQLYRKNTPKFNPVNKQELLDRFTQQAKQADWSQWLAKGRMQYLLEIACQCLPDEQLPVVLDLALENTHHSQDAVELLKAYTENNQIKKHLQRKRGQFVNSLEEACFDEALRVDDIDHLEQILSDVTTLEVLAEQDSALSNRLDLMSIKYLVYEKIEDVYFGEDKDLTDVAGKDDEVAALKRKTQEYQEQVEYVDSLFATLDTELNSNGVM